VFLLHAFAYVNVDYLKAKVLGLQDHQ